MRNRTYSTWLLLAVVVMMAFAAVAVADQKMSESTLIGMPETCSDLPKRDTHDADAGPCGDSPLAGGLCSYISESVSANNISQACHPNGAAHTYCKQTCGLCLSLKGKLRASWSYTVRIIPRSSSYDHAEFDTYEFSSLDDALPYLSLGDTLDWDVWSNLGTFTQTHVGTVASLTVPTCAPFTKQHIDHWGDLTHDILERVKLTFDAHYTMDAFAAH